MEEGLPLRAICAFLTFSYRLNRDARVLAQRRSLPERSGDQFNAHRMLVAAC